MRKLMLAATALVVLSLVVFGTIVAANSMLRPTKFSTIDPAALTRLAKDLPVARDAADPF